MSHHHHIEPREFEYAAGTMVLESNIHEGAAVVSSKIALKTGCTLPSLQLAKVMAEVAEAIESVGGIIGHIKAFASDANAQVIHLSITDASQAIHTEGPVDSLLDEKFSIEMVLIVFGLTLEQLQAFVEESASKLLG